MKHGGLKNVRKVIFISVNSYVHHEKGWERKSKTLGSIPVASAANARIMERYSEDTLMFFRSLIERFRKDEALEGKVGFYPIELDFTKFKKDGLKDYFLQLPTTFDLPDKVVDELGEAAHTLLRENSKSQRLAKDLGATAPKSAQPTNH